MNQRYSTSLPSVIKTCWNLSVSLLHGETRNLNIFVWCIHNEPSFSSENIANYLFNWTVQDLMFWDWFLNRYTPKGYFSYPMARHDGCLGKFIRDALISSLNKCLSTTRSCWLLIMQSSEEVKCLCIYCYCPHGEVIVIKIWGSITVFTILLKFIDCISVSLSRWFV